MSDDWADEIARRISGKQTDLECYKDARSALARARSELWKQIQARLREEADAVNIKLQQPYFQVSAIDSENLSLTVESPAGKIEIGFLDFLNVLSVSSIKEGFLAESKKEKMKRFQFEMKDGEAVLRDEEENQYLSTGDLVKYALELLV